MRVAADKAVFSLVVAVWSGAGSNADLPLFRLTARCSPDQPKRVAFAEQDVQLRMYLARRSAFGCRVEPYLIKATALRAAAPGRARTGRAAWRPVPPQRAGQSGCPRCIGRCTLATIVSRPEGHA
jgi:hypothetical protein